MNQTAIQEYLSAVFPDLLPGETINVRAFHARSGRRGVNQFHATIEEAQAAICQIPSDMEIYVGVNPRVDGDGTKAGVTRVQLYHTDADWKHYEGERQDGWDAVIGWDLEPSLVTDSGNGFHAYWFLKESLHPSQIALAEQHMARLYFALGGLDAVQDVSRILRVAGTFNNKHPESRKEVRIVYQSSKRYTPEDFEAVLPALPLRLEYKETSEVVGDGERPSLGLLRELLSHIDPCVPYDQYYPIWGAVAYYYPGEEGLALVDEWSSEAREAAGQFSSPRTQPNKHAGFRRQVGRVSTLGTLIHLAKQGGYVPPPRPLNVVIQSPPRPQRGNAIATIRRLREDQHRAKLALLPNPNYEDLPWGLQMFYDLLGPLADPFPRDYTTVMALTFASAMWPKVKFENLGLNLWAMGVIEQGSGKNAVTDPLQDVIARMKTVDPTLYTSGTPEGMYRLLDGDNKQLLCYLGEFGDFLATLSREHMKGARGVFCNLYDARPISHQLSKGELKITDPYCIMVGTTTPKVVVANMKEDDLLGGFASRYWYLANDWVNESPNFRPTREAVAELAAIFDEHVRDLANVRAARFDCPVGTVPQVYRDYQIACGIGTGEVRTFADALDDPKMPKGRHLARVKKAAANLELLEKRPMVQDGVVIVRQKNLELAISLVKRTEVYQDMVINTVASGDEERVMDKIQRTLDKAGANGLSRAEVMQKAHVKASDLRNLLPVLQEAGYVEEHWVDDRPRIRSTTLEEPLATRSKGGP